MKAYLNLLYKVLRHGRQRVTRAGPTLSLFGESFDTDLIDSFPLITTRKIIARPILGELAAFLTGSQRLDTFKNYGCHYWDANAEAWKPGERSVGKIYGYQWRYWNGTFDQLEALVNGLREDPDSRRHILTTWNPSDLPDMCLPPCHMTAQFQIQDGYLDCIVYMRSVDLCLGFPADLVLYGAFLIALAKTIGREAGHLTFFFGDAHIYLNHITQAEEQITRSPIPQPQWFYDNKGINSFTPNSIRLEGYESYDPINYKLNV